MAIDLDGITLDALHAFAVFTEHANFTRAAEELHLSQPALHVKINKLATALGVRLYERDGRSLHVTPAGHDAARFATEMDANVRSFVRHLGATADPSPVTIAAGEGAHLYVLAHGIRRLLASDVEIRLLNATTDDTVAAVRDERADLGVTVLQARPKGLAVRELATYQQVLALPSGHPLARNRTVRLTDLTGASLVVPPPDRPHRGALDRSLRRAGVSVSIGIEAEGWAQMLHFVSLGIGVAVVNGCITPPDDLVTRPIADLPPVTYSTILRRDGLNDASIRSVVDVIESSVP